MEDRRTGRIIRTLRQRRGWRQEDLGTRAGVSQDTVSRLERGDVASTPLRRLRAITAALDADLYVTVRWRGGDLDRLVDERHATLVGQVSHRLARLGWDARPEVTYSIYGERGSIDLLCWQAATRTVLVVEVKSELASVEETLRRHDAKARLAMTIAREQFGWPGLHVGRLIVLPDTSTARRRVARHEAVLTRAYPTRGPEARRWLRSPAGGASALVFVTSAGVDRGGVNPSGRHLAGPKRVRGSRC